MNLHVVVISALFAGCMVMMALIARSLFTRAASDYQSHFKAEASATLADLFLFIDADKLFRINLIAVLMVVSVTWLATGLWVPALIAAVFMFFLPRVVYGFMHRRRMQTFVLQLPDALLAIASAMKAGSSLVQAMEIMVAETRGPISQEFGLFQREMRIGVPYEDALANLVMRGAGEAEPQATARIGFVDRPFRPRIDGDARGEGGLIQLQRIDMVGQLHPEEDAALRLLEFGRGAELLAERVHQCIELGAQAARQLRHMGREMRRAIF